LGGGIYWGDKALKQQTVIGGNPGGLRGQKGPLQKKGPRGKLR